MRRKKATSHANKHIRSVRHAENQITAEIPQRLVTRTTERKIAAIENSLERLETSFKKIAQLLQLPY